MCSANGAVVVNGDITAYCRMQLTSTSTVLRPWREGDAPALARNANDPEIAANLRDGFPHPYSLLDARGFIERAPSTFFCIEVDGEAAGGIGFRAGHDVERYSAELGYWLARRHWGRGIVSEAVTAVRKHVFRETELRRLFAVPYATSFASIRVLEKCGFTLEGTMRSSAFKAGRFVDQLLYAVVDEDSVAPARHALTILAVSELARAVAFYRAALRWPVAVETPVYVELAHPDGVRLGLYDRSGFSRNTTRAVATVPDRETASCELYFYSSDLESAVDRVAQAGGTLLSAIAPRAWGDDAAYFLDPFGHVVVLARRTSARQS
ncbi:MAG: GNAT family N-acetyltransferase [Deltaproteobacteria bacterium]|nr:GNAT family N-acetyltransferase [Deltaproteobacteria bacterium]